MFKYFKKAILASLLVFIAVLVVHLIKQTGASNAPLGIHGHYDTADDKLYKIQRFSKDSVLAVFREEGCVIMLDLYGGSKYTPPPQDSTRYTIKGLSCWKDSVNAYIEFGKDSCENTTLYVLWFDAAPTKDDEEYIILAKNYQYCFECLLKKHKLID